MFRIVRSHCANCPAAQDQSPLVQLGVDMQRFDHVIALAGNPNVGKSTLFNALTGLRQHTGNWPGKTVTRAEGTVSYDGKQYKLVDLPGTYSLLATSYDEEVARDFILFGQPDVTLVVADAGRLERNLNLALQVMEITDRVVVCLNLMDEARRHRLTVDDKKLADELGVPVVPASARYDKGVDRVLQTIHQMAAGEIVSRPKRIVEMPPQFERPVSRLSEQVEAAYPRLPNSRWVAVRLLDGDERIAQAVRSGELGDLSQGRVLGGDQDTSRGAGFPACHDQSADFPASHDQSADFPACHDQSADFPTSHDQSAGWKACPTPEGKLRDELLETASDLRWEVGPDFHQTLVESIYAHAARIADRTVTRKETRWNVGLDYKLDRILTGRWLGFPAMIVLLTFVLWLTVAGANVPSAMISSLLIDTIHPALKAAASSIGMPWWLDGVLIDGMYLATAWVISVMLPPMAIFFPLFTLLEDFGYLPRVAFNLDRMFKRVGGHGKQSLSMCMGLGCNAAGVVATRIIDSPRERLVAIITNNFALCNGRWPTQILLATIFLGALAPAYLAGFVSAVAVVSVALLGVAFTFLTSWGLSRTVLRGEPSTFQLELPPYRPPRLLQTLYTSLIDRTIFVLWRAIVFALPAGAVIWLVSNISIGGSSLAEHLIHFLNPLGMLIGLNGVILLAYVVAIPANEIVIPTILMLTVVTTGMTGVGEGAGVMFDLTSTKATARVLHAGGWTVLTGVCVMLFSLLHNPCSTTIYTTWKETGSAKWTAVAALLPLAMGFVLCFLIAQLWPLIAGG